MLFKYKQLNNMCNSYQGSYGHHVLGGSRHSRYSDNSQEYLRIHEHSQRCHPAHIHQHLHSEKERPMTRQNQEFQNHQLSSMPSLSTTVCKLITPMLCQQAHFIWSMMIQPLQILPETVIHAQ